ncbi:MAG: hypothetical protein AB2A00_21340 [Myxococcota bacterium]
MRPLVVAMLLLGALVLWPSYVQKTHLVYQGVGGDDFCYFAHASSLAYLQWPDYRLELTCRGEYPMASIGPGLLAAPFVFVFSLLDRLAGHAIVHVRAPDNVVGTWSVFGFEMATAFYFGLTCLLLFQLARRRVPELVASWSVVLMVLCQGTLLYVWRRPIFSHVFELFTLTALLFALDHRAHLPVEQRSRWRWSVLVGTACALAALTRYNNVPIAAAWPLIFGHFLGTADGRRQEVRFIARTVVVALPWLLVFKVIPTLMAREEKYAGEALGVILKGLAVTEWPRRFGWFLLGDDWGLVFTAPFVLVAVVGLVMVRFPDRRVYAWLAATLLVNLYLTVNFGSQGGFYGYRYFVFSAMPVLLVPFAHFLEASTRRRPLHTRVMMVLMAIPPLVSMGLFEGNDTNLAMRLTPQWGRSDWGVAHFQREVWSTILNHPAQALMILFKGVPAYAAFLVASLVGMEHVLPAVLREKFSPVSWLLLGEVLALWVTPVLTILVTTRLAARMRRAQP